MYMKFAIYIIKLVYMAFCHGQLSCFMKFFRRFCSNDAHVYGKLKNEGACNMHSNNEKILPIKPPFAKCYPTDTYLLSVLLNNEDAKSWIFNQHINLYGYITKEKWIYQAYSLNDYRKSCPFLSFSQIIAKGLISSFGGVSNLIKSCILEGYYVISQYDQYYIPLSSNYNKWNTVHELFIYGYESSEKSFLVADFFTLSGLSFGRVSSDALEQAIWNVPSEEFRIDILKLIDYEYKFDIKLLQKELVDYLNSTKTVFCYEDNTLTLDESDRLRKNEFVFGENNYDLICNLLLHLIDVFNTIDKGDYHGIMFRVIRSAHIFYSHKIFMNRRLTFLYENKIITHSLFYDEYHEVESLCLITRNMLIKCSQSRNIKLLAKAIENYNTSYAFLKVG